MSDQQQPDVRWAPIEPKPAKRGRIWLIVGLVVAALVIVGALLFFLLPRGEAAEPSATGSPSPSASPSDSVTPPAETAEPTTAPTLTPPTAPEPSVDAFRDQVSGWLNDAPRGLDIVAASNGEEALPVIDTLQQDAQRLADALPPSSINDAWRDGVAAYSQRLAELRSAATGGSGVADAVQAARSAVQGLRTIVGL